MLGAMVASTDPIRAITPASWMVRRRPSRWFVRAEKIAPMTAPIATLAVSRPVCQPERSHCSVTNGRTPAMMPRS